MSQINDRTALRNVLVLATAQAVVGAQMSVIFNIAGLAGQNLAINACLATLPITAAVLGSMLTATPLSAFMARHGRRAGFSVGMLGGMLGAVLGAAGLLYSNFWLFVAGGLFTGVYMSTQGFYRFAAADTASEAFRPKAISWVLAGGLFSAVLGREIVNLTADWFVIPFLGCYLAAIALNAFGFVLFRGLNIPTPPAPLRGAAGGRSKGELLRTPAIAVAIICATVSYALMNLVMTSSPLAIVGCGYETRDSTNVVMSHVLAMYAPSFFTGHVIARLGAERVVAIGLVILAGAGAVAMAGVDILNFFAALILLGIGWNFGFIGATAMLTAAQRPEERGRLQGLNDLIVFGGVTAASLASGGLMNCSGGTVQAGWQAVNLAMAPFLVLAGGALIWFLMRPKETR